MWANKLIREKPDLALLRGFSVKIAYLSSQEEKTTGNGKKIVYGECKKISDSMQWAAPYDFAITIYEPNCCYFTDDQLQILLWHELKHIGIDIDSKEPKFYIIPHDIEEFNEIIIEHGLTWDKVV